MSDMRGQHDVVFSPGHSRTRSRESAEHEATKAKLAKATAQRNLNGQVRCNRFERLHKLRRLLQEVPNSGVTPGGAKWASVIDARDKLRKWQKQWLAETASDNVQI